MSAPSGVPLARLFATAYRQIIDTLHTRLRERGWLDVRPAFGFVLLAARDGTTSTTELAALMGTTKQAASVLAATMTEAGYIEAAAEVTDRRQRRLQLTERGRALLTAVELVYAEIEAEWAAVIGDRVVERLRTDVTRAITATNQGSLPPVRPTW